ncbi:MAG: hypothetical protein ACJ8AO_07625, partial [Gemmatimonadaceae bacterium]
RVPPEFGRRPRDAGRGFGGIPAPPIRRGGSADYIQFVPADGGEPLPLVLLVLLAAALLAETASRRFRGAR